jgi:hypothetical protein
MGLGLQFFLSLKPCPGAHLLLRFVGSGSHRQTENPWPGGVWVGSGPQGWKSWGCTDQYSNMACLITGKDDVDGSWVPQMSKCHHDNSSRTQSALWIPVCAIHLFWRTPTSSKFGWPPIHFDNNLGRTDISDHLGISNPHFGLVTHPSYSQTFGQFLFCERFQLISNK